jgi:hypothetical protein
MAAAAAGWWPVGRAAVGVPRGGHGGGCWRGDAAAELVKDVSDSDDLGDRSEARGATRAGPRPGVPSRHGDFATGEPGAVAGAARGVAERDAGVDIVAAAVCDSCSG